MSESTPFEFVCSEIERATSLTSLEARGTVRIALKAAGIEARTATPAQLHVILEKLIPGELKKRGCEDAESLCKQIAKRMAGRSFDAVGPSSPEAVFARLGGELPEPTAHAGGQRAGGAPDTPAARALPEASDRLAGAARGGAPGPRARVASAASRAPRSAARRAAGRRRGGPAGGRAGACRGTRRGRGCGGRPRRSGSRRCVSSSARRRASLSSVRRRARRGGSAPAACRGRRGRAAGGAARGRSARRARRS